jgi:membrane protease YdiL (CAAX protease family)
MGLLVKGRFLVALVENSVSSARYQTDKRGLRMEAYPPPAQGTQVLSAPPVAPVAPLPNPAAFYKKSLRSTIMRIFLALLLFLVINLFVQFVVGIALAFSGAFQTLYQGTDIDFSELMASLPLGWLLLLSMVTGIPAFLLIHGKRMFTEDLTTVNERIKLPDFAALLGLTLGCGAVIQLGLIGLELILQSAGLSLPTGGVPPLQNITDPVALLYIILIGPICEEIIFRGAILRALQPYGANFAIVLSALLFALIHGYLYQAINAFFIGLILAYCAWRFSIKWSMLLHILNNGIAMTMDLTAPTDTLILAVYGIFLVLAVIAAIPGFKKFRQQRRDGKAPELPLPSNPSFAPRCTPTEVTEVAANTGAAAIVDMSMGEGTIPLHRARPFAIAFTSPWLITLLVLGLCFSLYLLFFSPPLTL